MEPSFFAGELATELIKAVVQLGKKAIFFKSKAKQLEKSLQQLLPIIEEIKYSGVELPQFRQTQLDELTAKIRDGLEQVQKASTLARWNVYKNLQFSKKMEKLEKYIARFVNYQFPAHILADVHVLRVETSQGLQRLETQIERFSTMRIVDVFMEETIRKMDEENDRNLGFPVVGVTFKVAKEKLKNELFRPELSVIGLCGMGGCGKTTLAREISKDPEVKRRFTNGIIFETVSQSPNVEDLRRRLLSHITGNRIFGGQILVILDDVWSLSDLEKLVFKMSGCKTLVVSRSRYPTILQSTYELELLGEEEALSLFCYYAFGQERIPSNFDKKLVNQVVQECKGLPLALKVIGAFLRDQPPKIWASAKNRLSRGEAISESHEVSLLERMGIGIESLSRKVRECFLDLGSFPEDKKIPLDVLINMWVEIHDLEEADAFAILIELSNKNLLTLTKDAQNRAGDMHSSYNELSVTQHDVLRDLALHMNNNNNINQSKRLIMPRRENGLPKDWERNADQPFDAQIVSIHTGEMRESDWFDIDFPKTEVLILSFSAGEYFLPPFLKRMPKLKALVMINYGSTSTILQNLSVFTSLVHLRSLWLEKIAVPPLPKTTIPLQKLRKISLILCEVGRSFICSDVDLSVIFPHLTYLGIDHCIDLTYLPSSICRIFSLENLSITNCHDLFELPEQLGSLDSLQILRLYACPSLKHLPQGICGLRKLIYLDISQCINLRNLPEGMGALRNLEKIDMRECSQIRNLPRSAKLLRSLGYVTCDEEIAYLWQESKKSIPDLCVQVVEESFTLDWLVE